MKRNINISKEEWRTVTVYSKHIKKQRLVEKIEAINTEEDFNARVRLKVKIKN